MAKRIRRYSDHVRRVIDEGLRDYHELVKAGLIKPVNQPNRRGWAEDQSVMRLGKPLPYSCLGPLLAEAHRIERSLSIR